MASNIHKCPSEVVFGSITCEKILRKTIVNTLRSKWMFRRVTKFGLICTRWIWAKNVFSFGKNLNTTIIFTGHIFMLFLVFIASLRDVIVNRKFIKLFRPIMRLQSSFSTTRKRRLRSVFICWETTKWCTRNVHPDFSILKIRSNGSVKPCRQIPV